MNTKKILLSLGGIVLLGAIAGTIWYMQNSGNVTSLLCASSIHPPHLERRTDAAGKVGGYIVTSPTQTRQDFNNASTYIYDANGKEIARLAPGATTEQTAAFAGVYADFGATYSKSEEIDCTANSK